MTKDFFIFNWLIIKNRILFNTKQLIRTYKVNVPKSTLIMGKVDIIRTHKDAHINLGENVTLRSDSFVYHVGMPFNTTILCEGSGSLVEIGDQCRINGTYIHARKKIKIGGGCLFAAGTNIIDSNGHKLNSKDRIHTTDDPIEISIGSNVWVCSNSIILKGTNIGDNCVVSANSVVKGNFPANSIIQGNPATIVGTLDIK